MRDAVGDRVDLLIEGHSRFNVATAVELAEAMEPFRPAWFEEPVPHTNIAAMVEVARRSPVPIATGESFSNKQQFADLLKHDAVNISAAGAAEPGRIVRRAQDRGYGGRALWRDRAAQRAGSGVLGGVCAVECVDSEFLHSRNLR